MPLCLPPPITRLNLTHHTPIRSKPKQSSLANNAHPFMYERNKPTLAPRCRISIPHARRKDAIQQSRQALVIQSNPLPLVRIESRQSSRPLKQTTQCNANCHPLDPVHLSYTSSVPPVTSTRSRSSHHPSPPSSAAQQYSASHRHHPLSPPPPCQPQ